MASDVQPKAAPGTLWKPEPREKKTAQPMKRSAPINPVGKVTKQRAADKRAKLKAEPARADGKRQCYIGLEWAEKVDLEHVIDASVRPDLRSDPRNHKWACNFHNIGKKNGTLTEIEQARVDAAIEEVLYG